MTTVSPARIWHLLAVCCSFNGLACAGEPEPESVPVDMSAEPAAPIALPALPPDAVVSESTRPALCQRAGADVVRDAFCAASAPSIQSLADLQRALKLHIVPSEPGVNQGPATYATQVVLTHSTSLSGVLVSPLNPRAIITTNSTFMAFARGIQQVELIALDRDTQRFNFYLLSFRQACSMQAQGCSPGDLYTPSVESGWLMVALQDDEELKNTPSDCRQCHQRGLDKPMLLMRERDGPWTHFFAPEPGPNMSIPEEVYGNGLVRDYVAAKGDEPYAGLPVAVMSQTLGFSLQNLVLADQPLNFDGATIVNERWPWSPEGFASEPQRSATWDYSYEAFKRGELLALPFYGLRATDPDKQATLTEAYVSYRDGTLPAASLPDFADIYPEDAQTRAEIGLQTEPDADPPDLLIQACGQCHNDVLDQSLSRARFSIALGRLARGEIDAAIARLTLARTHPLVMPPSGRRQLDAAGRARLLEYLKQPTRKDSADDELLERAAQLGMAQHQELTPAQLATR